MLEAAQEREPNSVPVNLALGRAYLKAGDGREGDRGDQPLRERAPGREPARAGRVAAARDGGGRPRRRQDLPAHPGGRPEARRQGGDRQGVPEARRGLREKEAGAQRRGGDRKISRAQPGRRGGDPAPGAPAGPGAGAEGRGAPADAAAGRPPPPPPRRPPPMRGGCRRDQPRGRGLRAPPSISRAKRSCSSRSKAMERRGPRRAGQRRGRAGALRQGAPEKASEFLEEHLGATPATSRPGRRSSRRGGSLATATASATACCGWPTCTAARRGSRRPVPPTRGRSTPTRAARRRRADWPTSRRGGSRRRAAARPLPDRRAVRDPAEETSDRPPVRVHLDRRGGDDARTGEQRA